MQEFNSENVRKIWQRVQQANAPVSENPDLCGCVSRALDTAEIYARLSRRIPGRNGQILAQFARREQSHAASIKGICAVTYGKCPPIRSKPPENMPVQVLLRRCYGQTLQAIADYEKLSAQESYGNIFKKIINEEQSQLLFLLQLLGTLENRR